MSKVAKIDLFIEQIEEKVSTLGVTDSVVKPVVGDSIKNNRVISVSQLLRYLLNSSSSSDRKLGKSLNSLYSLVRPSLGRIRREVFENQRSDSFDYNEFIRIVHYFQTDRTFRKVAGQVL